jgi:DNA-binding PadR family transcriptional regulator
MSSSERALTTTSYAILGLLAIRPWTTYELAKHMNRSLGRLWPRAQSKIYEEPKELVKHGLAKASADRVGNRPRTVYSITLKGRRTLRHWLARPSRGPSLEHEQLLKIFFAEHGSRADVVGRIDEMKQWALAQRAEHLVVGSSYLAGTGLFQERAAQLLLTGGFLLEFTEMVLRWCDWAADIVAKWPEDVAAATLDRRAMEQLLARARDKPRGSEPDSS